MGKIYSTLNTFNSYKGMSRLSYNIIEKLFSNEDIWKLIYYTEPDALSRDNLTPEQKSNLIWAGQEDQENYSVYLVPLTENINYNSKVIIKIYCVDVNPTNQEVGTILYALEILCQSRISMLSDRRSRPEVLLEEILNTINGEEIGGVSELFFNNDSGGENACGSEMVIDQKRNYSGYLTVFGVHYGNIQSRPAGY